MSDFEARWRELASAARRHESALDQGPESSSARVDTVRAAAIASRARATPGRVELSDLRGLVVAASLFCACLLGLSWSANRFGFAASIEVAAHDLVQLASCTPATSFIPPPPGLDAVSWIPAPKLETERVLGPGIELLSYLDGWLARTPTTPEIPR